MAPIEAQTRLASTRSGLRRPAGESVSARETASTPPVTRVRSVAHQPIGHEREVVQGAEQAAIAGPAERQVRHPRALIGDVRGGDADDGQPFTHRVRKHGAQPLRFTHRDDDRKPGPFADEGQMLTTTDAQEVAVPVAEPRGGLDGRQVADLFQPDKQLLCAPENDHHS